MQAELLSEIIRDYGSQDMGEARWLWEEVFLNPDYQSPDDHAEAFFKAPETMNAFPEDLERARRRLSHHFLWIGKLARLRLLNRETLLEAASLWKVQFLRFVVEPVEKERNKEADTGAFDALKHLHGISKEAPTKKEYGDYKEALRKQTGRAKKETERET